ncbi:MULTISPECIES: hypothetical protein [unclassified Janthinobacterium]|jgi:hypothetical protein|uniref:hypothetical protein n=1 Tax=unclassified Janthinobacterium TaxID=2610881 RepID=UPI001E5632A7|nr:MULTISPECIES: hypothetical protein [unclassified Janthinobacterium]MCC7641715.1 hypothetical protein [Janthinobacterium sp. EB271-G4-3-1]MCC7690968.1 hypothetical protein [Janthinobacterium sp. EB271-G4-3-2]
MNKQKGKPTVRRKRMFGSYGLARIAMLVRQQDWRSAFFITDLINHAPTKERNCKVVYLHFDIPVGNKIRLRRGSNRPPWHTLSPVTKQVFTCARARWPIMAFYRIEDDRAASRLSLTCRPD